jgi:hypothetical protein
MASVDFDAARRERIAGLDPPAFTLGGMTFTCKPLVPFESLLRIIEFEATVKDRFRHSCEFIAGCFAEESDRELWAKVLTNDDDPVGEADVDGVVMFLVGAYSARPTSPSAGSSGGRRRTGGRSKPKGTGSSDPKASGG